MPYTKVEADPPMDIKCPSNSLVTSSMVTSSPAIDQVHAQVGKMYELTHFNRQWCKERRQKNLAMLDVWKGWQGWQGWQGCGRGGRDGTGPKDGKSNLTCLTPVTISIPLKFHSCANEEDLTDILSGKLQQSIG